ncbi:hypothetical protein [Vitiosangium sp. GDMCC 1.1324]|uniref:hypothetical protein n=1 Tax=Vitiosangium sp. (strain GDMCC 1.1324) TaxID=2138576 RepID=UPI000D373787|nr:hypothetical protein [Vitiosangium sp. GDMCC 1.1324]PTL84928.1 hypothetical protein DAT35_07705 [Vitiosangium sp. GDMCC 1.1324]
MRIPSFAGLLRLLPISSEVRAGAPADNMPRAVRLLGAGGLADARHRAEHVLESARRCTCCRELLAHMFDRLGSTLFLDDDPAALARAFEDAERDAFSVRVLAACIVLSGRERVAPAL